MSEADRRKLEEQRAALERARQTLESQRADLEKSRQAFEVDRQQLEKARQLLEKTLKEQADKLQSAASPELQKKLEELHRQMDDFARKESDKALQESAQARQESGLATKEAELARQEAALAAHSADLAHQQAQFAQADSLAAKSEAEIRRSQADRLQVSTPAEMDKRRKFAKEHCGGEDTDRGRVAMKYGMPDQLEVHGSQGEDWRYESRGAVRKEMAFHFDGNGKLGDYYWVRDTAQSADIDPIVASEVRRRVAERAKSASKEDLDKRRKFAREHCGGEDTDRGRIVMQYGLPDQLEVYGKQGEAWRYEVRGRDGAVLQLLFDGNGKIVDKGPGLRSSPSAIEAERDRRTKYANDKWAKLGGAASDKGKAYIKYGPPDEIRTETGGGETWLYRNEAKDRVRLEIKFDANGRLALHSWGEPDRAENERRTKYANEKWAKEGGAASNKGKTYIMFGPPDEIKTEGGGEKWSYKSVGKGRTQLQVVFDAEGKGTWITTRYTENGQPYERKMSTYSEVPELR
jgi:chemotaxis protein histidine kinase CheA